MRHNDRAESINDNIADCVEKYSNGGDDGSGNVDVDGRWKGMIDLGVTS